MNANDLAFFNSIGSKVSKRVKTFSKDELSNIVKQEFAQFDTQKLEDIWQLKRALLPLIAANDGGNTYSIPRGLVHERTKRVLSTPRALHQGIQELRTAAADVAEDEPEHGGADDDDGDDGDGADDDIGEDEIE